MSCIAGAVERALAILGCFSSGQRTLGLTEISRMLDLRKSTVHRLLAILTKEGMIARDVTNKRYRLGYKVFQLGAQFASQYQMRKVALPVMRRLWEQSGETVTLSIRVGQRRIYLEQLESPAEMRVSVEIGKPLPLYCGSGGKVFLAWMGHDEVERGLAESGLAPITPNTITDRRYLEADLELTRARGYAMSKGERVMGASAVSAPIRDSRGALVAAVGVSGPAARLDGELLLDVARLVVRAGQEISEQLGYRAEIGITTARSITV